MRRFQFRLQSVLELRESQRGQCRARLAECVATARELDEQRQACERELNTLKQQRQQSQIGQLDVRNLAHLQRCETALRADLRSLVERIAAAEQAIDEARQTLIAADREVRVIERLKEKQLDRHQRQAAAADARALDDVIRSAAGEEQSL